MPIKPGDALTAQAARDAVTGKLHAEIDGYCWIWERFTIVEIEPNAPMKFMPGAMYDYDNGYRPMHWLCTEHGKGKREE